MPPPEAPPGPSVSVVVVVGGSCVLRYSRPPPPPPAPSPPPPWGQRGPPNIRPREGDLLLLLRSLGPGAPPEPVAATSFVGPEPQDLLPTDEDLGSPSSTRRGPGYGLGWPQEPAPAPAPFAVELPRGPGGFGFSLQGGPAGVFVRGLREGGPAQRCGCIQVSDELLAINGAPTAGMSHAQALARIRGGAAACACCCAAPMGRPRTRWRGGCCGCAWAAPRGGSPASASLGGCTPEPPLPPGTPANGRRRRSEAPPPHAPHFLVLWGIPPSPSPGGNFGAPHFGGGVLQAMQCPRPAFWGSHGGVVPLPIFGGVQ